MRILQVNSFFSVGGPPRIMNGIHDTLKENGHECRIAAAREKMLFLRDSFPIGTTFGVYRNALISRVLDNDGFVPGRATHKLIEMIKEYDPDIIQLHNLHGYYINVEILFEFLKVLGKPIVWTLHDCWPITGHCPHFSLIGCNRYKSGCYACPLKNEYPASYIFDRSRSNWKKKMSIFSKVPNMVIVTPSKWLADIVKDSYLGVNSIKVISNGIDLDTFSIKSSDLRYEYELYDKKIVLGVAQNWAEHKGLEDFIHLSTLLGDNFQVVLIGLTEKQLNDLPPTVLGIKRTKSTSELAQWYSLAHVFVNLTYQDTFPTVNIEAMACGTPVITYDTGGSPEAIDDTCGFVVSQGDVERVASTIQMLKDKSFYQLSTLKRSKMFDRRIKYLEYIRLYEDMLQSKK